MPPFRSIILLIHGEHDNDIQWWLGGGDFESWWGAEAVKKCCGYWVRRGKTRGSPLFFTRLWYKPSYYTGWRRGYIRPLWPVTLGTSTTEWTISWHPKVKEGITKSRLNEFYYGRNDFLTLQNLLSEFTQQDQTSETQQDVDFLNIFKSTLDAWKNVDQVDTFQNMMFSW